MDELDNLENDMKKDPKVQEYLASQSKKKIALERVDTAEQELMREIVAISHNQLVNQRWFSIAKTHIEQGIMALRRAIIKPDERQG